MVGRGGTKKVSSRAPGAGIANSRLQTLRRGADTIITNAKNLKADFSLNYFKERFYREVIGIVEKQPPQTAQISFFQHLENFIVSKQSIFQPATIKTYITLKKSLQQFEEVTGYKLAFDTINHIFITLYKKYLIEDTGVINNTIAKRIATLKAFLTEMGKQKISTNSDYENFEASRNYETTVMYLTEHEMMDLFELKTEKNSTEQHVQDVFCFSCFTGIRFSDWGSLKPENIVQIHQDGHTVPVLKFTMFKVHKEVIVPLNHHALSKIQKYKGYSNETGYLFPLYTNQETNRTLKDLTKRAEINEIIVEVKKSGANRITYTDPKHKILTCHDARNTYATLYLEKGGRPEVLQRILGHTDIKQTMRYVKIIPKSIITDHLQNEERAKGSFLKKREGFNNPIQ
ncbi:MAG: tyrosine-type recombinase/integrase [Chitinophagaceae bacterium]